MVECRLAKAYEATRQADSPDGDLVCQVKESEVDIHLKIGEGHLGMALAYTQKGNREMMEFQLDREDRVKSVDEGLHERIQKYVIGSWVDSASIDSKSKNDIL
jgi:hypothetical protein